MKPKPLYGDPCNRCGLCCRMSACPLNEVVLGGLVPCPMLTADGLGGFFCGLIERLRTDGEKEAARVVLGVGFGCDAIDSAEDARRSQADRPRLLEEMAKADAGLSPAGQAAMARWRTVYMAGRYGP